MKNKYSLSWMYEEFVLSEFKGNKQVSTFKAPFLVSSLDDFKKALFAAKTELSIKKNSELSIVYKSELLRHSFVELPPMSKKDISQYLSRNVDKEKSFSEEAKYSFKSASRSGVQDGVLLHILPKSNLKGIKEVCSKLSFTLRKVIPFTEIISASYAKETFEPKKTLVFVALFNKHIEILVADSQGNSFFVRELNIKWDLTNLDRLKLDVERTILYTKQQNSNAKKIIVLGESSTQVSKLLQPSFKVPIETYIESEEDNFWANSAITVSNRVSSNFIPYSVNDSLVNKSTLTISQWAAIGSVLMAIATTVMMNSMRLEGNQELIREVNQLEDRLSNLQRQYNHLNQQRLLTDTLLEKPIPVAPLFMYDLGNLVSDSMFLSKASIEQKDGAWKFMLEGANNPTLANSAGDLKALENSLESPPWNANVSDEWRAAWLEKLRQGKANDNGLIAFAIQGEF